MVEHYSHRIQNVIQKELFKAQKSIKIAVAWFTNDLLFQPLLLKLQAGVKVEIVLNRDEINDSENNEADFNAFVKIGGILHWNESKELMHDKFCIIDDLVVLFGTYNWTYKAEYNHESICVIKEDTDAIASFDSLFESLCNRFPKVASTVYNGLNDSIYDTSTTPPKHQTKENSKLKSYKEDEDTIYLNLLKEYEALQEEFAFYIDRIDNVDKTFNQQDLNELKMFAEKEMPVSLLWLGTMYMYGLGGEENYMKAEEYLLRCCNNKYTQLSGFSKEKDLWIDESIAEAYIELAILHELTENGAGVIECIRKANRLGNPLALSIYPKLNARYRVGVTKRHCICTNLFDCISEYNILFYSDIIPPENGWAMLFASLLGEISPNPAKSKYQKGMAYLSGSNIWGNHKVDFKEGFKKLIESEHGCETLNIYLIGILYAFGLCGIKQNKSKAVELFFRAARNGIVAAMCDLGICYLSGFGVQQDINKAMEWLLKASKCGDKYAAIQCHILQSYFNDSGTDTYEKEVNDIERRFEQEQDSTYYNRYGCGYFFHHRYNSVTRFRLSSYELEDTSKVTIGTRFIKHLADSGEEKAKLLYAAFAICGKGTQINNNDAIKYMKECKTGSNGFGLAVIGAAHYYEFIDSVNKYNINKDQLELHILESYKNLNKSRELGEKFAFEIKGFRAHIRSFIKRFEIDNKKVEQEFNYLRTILSTKWSSKPEVLKSSNKLFQLSNYKSANLIIYGDTQIDFPKNI